MDHQVHPKILGTAALVLISATAYRSCAIGRLFMQMDLRTTSSVQWLTGIDPPGPEDFISLISPEFRSSTCALREFIPTSPPAAQSAMASSTSMVDTLVVILTKATSWGAGLGVTGRALRHGLAIGLLPRIGSRSIFGTRK